MSHIDTKKNFLISRPVEKQHVTGTNHMNTKIKFQQENDYWSTFRKLD